MDEELIRAACKAANCKYPDMEAMANFKREVTPSAVIGLLDGLRHAKGIAAINDARANGAAETIQHLRDDIAKLRAQLPSQGGEAVEVVAWQDAENPLYTTAERRVMHDWAGNGYPIVELMTVAQHQRILAAATHPADQVADGVVVSRELKVIEAELSRITHDPFTSTDTSEELAAVLIALRALLNGGPK